MDFKSIPNKFKPIPFWSWNERLECEETKRQVRVMKDAGIGGYFMHARGGLLTEYMGKEWFDNVAAALDEGEACGMDSWAYDENGWPSGFGDGKVLLCGEDYHLKSLTYKKDSEYDGEERLVLLRRDGYTYYYQPNPLYVDLLNPDVTDEFIRVAYEPYRERYGKRITGFFTDEPQLIRVPGYPWSVITENEFRSRYGYELREHIPELFFELGDYRRVRFDFWRMTTDLFSKNYFKRLYDWCEKYGYKLTGHLVMEDCMEDIISTNGSAMAHYEYFQVPGMDWLGRPVFDCLTPKQLGSVAAQMGQRQVLSETFALTGHNVSHGELKRIYEWQMVRGINLLCTHLEGYSNRGIRKRDYPAAIYYQQPWWDDARLFFDTMSRTGMLLSGGTEPADILLIHPLSVAWCMYNGFVEGRERAREIRAYNDKFLSEMRTLEDKHLIYHLGDETVMERHARVEDGAIVIGECRYTRVILTDSSVLFESTRDLLSRFERLGGKIYSSADELEQNPITAPSRVSYTVREYPDFRIHYFVNTDPTPAVFDVSVGESLINAETGELSDFSGRCSLEPYESVLIYDSGKKRAPVTKKAEESELSLLGEWTVSGASYNSLTLDRCDYYLDGELVARGGYVLDILPRVNEKRRPVAVRQIFRFMIEEMPEGDIFLAAETPDMFDITVNGEVLSKRDVGDFRDISFRRLPITELVRVGENVIEFNSTVSQSEKTMRHLDNSWVFETMTNCISYDMEIEPIYIVGDFGVKINAPVTELDKGAYRVEERLIRDGGHSFVITRAPKTVVAERLEESGYPQFSGTLKLSKRVTLEDSERFVRLVGRGMNSVHIAVNGNEVATRMFAPYTVSLSDALKKGENLIELTLINNLRNMQGISHLKEGECHSANRNRFYRESNVFYHARGATDACHDVMPTWDDDVCLVHFGLGEEK